jgi:hypothetical protein
MMTKADLVDLAGMEELTNIYLELLLSTMSYGRNETARLLNVSPSSVLCWVYTGEKIDSSH